MDYGCLPFEVCRVVASIALGLFFTFAMWRHRDTVLPVHYMILGVVVLGTFEAASWLIAYSYMNKTGQQILLLVLNSSTFNNALSWFQPECKCQSALCGRGTATMRATTHTTDAACINTVLTLQGENRSGI